MWLTKAFPGSQLRIGAGDCCWVFALDRLDSAASLDYDLALKESRGRNAMSLRAKTAIAGLGITKMGKNYAHSNAIGFATEAIELALEDAGLRRTDLDGVLVNPGLT
jgi:hypothetical protein